MIAFTIQQLECWTQIKSHTLRVWEQRYKAFSPKRNGRQHRLYEPDDIQRALCLSLLTLHHSLTAQLAALPLSDLKARTRLLITASQPLTYHVVELLMAIVDNDADGFRQLLQANWHRVGGLVTLRKLILPFLQRLEDVWGSGLETVEEWASSRVILEQHLVDCTDRLPSPWRMAERYMIVQAKPGGFQLLPQIAHYLLLSQGYAVARPVLHESAELTPEALQSYRPKYVVAVLSGWPARSLVQSYIDQLVSLCTPAQVLLTGDRITGQDISVPEGAGLLHRIEELI
ncbi:MerR family transcriptional regulator [Spirosoma oryzicola]|uniref:MerR family transcriptional regulator n=1 Tax=Spirosoma oryzicola TaxID=2898794 RepID=UPI001E2DECA3|nr:MerR family transcriptional regulator [Spirosoma oryzicola]UHG94649.1 MerR family transcriptional regulator [Spirosoma oryzicola]